MKTALVLLLGLTTLSFAIEQRHNKREVRPASHEYKLNAEEVKEAVIQYAKSKGVSFPGGSSTEIRGLELRGIYFGGTRAEAGIVLYVTENEKE